MKIKAKFTFTEELLGTKSANPDIFATWQASKHPSGKPQADELALAKSTKEAADD